MSLCNVAKLDQGDFYFTLTKRPLFMPHEYPKWVCNYTVLIEGVQMEKTIVPHLQLQFLERRLLKSLIPGYLKKSKQGTDGWNFSYFWY